jgi:S-adenosylmethionine synthetase
MSIPEYTSEFISAGHPDKYCDQVSDAVLDAMFDLARALDLSTDGCRAAVETMAKENLVLVSGEIAAPGPVLAALNVDAIAKSVWSRVGYDREGVPTVINYLRPQSLEIAALVDGEAKAAGAGDQGIMTGCAYRGTAGMMPPEYAAARALIARLDVVRIGGQLPYLRSDAKSQVTLSADGEVLSAIISTQHDAEVPLVQLRADLAEHVVLPVLGDVPPERMMLNYKGSFVLGGTAADCGLTGRKIVADQYGPRVPVGGGAFSGKDPSKVDRSAAYMARLAAKTALVSAFPDAASAHVQIAYGIGQVQPSSLRATLDDGRDITGWLRDTFPDLSPRAIQQRLALWDRTGWRYGDTAAMGHFGRDAFPWEQVTAS